MKTYCLSKPMSRTEFLCMPEDLQAEYLRKLRERFGASNRMIGEMLGVSHTTIATLRRKLNVTTPAGTHTIPTQQQAADWEAWLNGEIAMYPVTEPSETKPEPEPAQITEPEPETPAPDKQAPATPGHNEQVLPRITGGTFTAVGRAGDTAQMLANLFTGDPRPVTITLTVTYTEADA